MRQLQFILLSILFFLFLLHPSFSLPSSIKQSQSVRFKLRRRVPDRLHHHPFHLRPLVAADRQRQHWIRSTIGRDAASSKCRSSSQAFEMPIGSGAYTGTGQYFVRVRVGTPAKPFVLVADTGSDLTWVKCQQIKERSHGTVEEKESSRPRVFKPEQSSSWRPIGCSSDLCQKTLPFALATCPAPNSPCLYDYSGMVIIHCSSQCGTLYSYVFHVKRKKEAIFFLSREESWHLFHSTSTSTALCSSPRQPLDYMEIRAGTNLEATRRNCTGQYSRGYEFVPSTTFIFSLLALLLFPRRLIPLLCSISRS